MKTLSGSKYFVAGFAILVSLIFLGFLGPIIWTGKSMDMGSYAAYQPPSYAHWLGTDVNGRDSFTVLMLSIGQSLLIGFIGGGISFLIALTLGLLAGYSVGLRDEALTSFGNILLVVPTWPILVMVAALSFRTTIVDIALIVALFSWPWHFRGIRAQVKGLKERPFIELARMNNENVLGILFKEIMPTMLSYLLVVLVGLISWTIANEVTLELIGLGPQNTSTLGIMIFWIQQSGILAVGFWWMVLPPVISLILIFMSLQFIVMGLDSVINPRLRE